MLWRRPGDGNALSALRSASGRDTGHHANRRDDLPGVPEGVLRPVEQEPEHRRRQLLSADGACIEERVLACRSELRERARDRGVELIGETRTVILAGRKLLLLGRQRRALCRGEGLAARVGEQPIERAAKMAMNLRFVICDVMFFTS
jgi:hypothetical protein